MKRKMKNKKEIKKEVWFKNRTELIVFLISFILAIVFFLWQRRFFSWDFSVYMMNAEHFLGLEGSYYFEWLRPPLVPALLMLFRPLGRTFSAYAFVVFCTCFYFFSLKLFHDKFLRKLKYSEVFYLFSINPFVLTYGLGIGTELISLSLIVLFVVFAFSAGSFAFFGASMLARYSNIILLPVVFLSKNIKKILIGIGIIILMFLPWLFTNYLFTGHALTSLGDYYALNSLEQAPPTFELRKLFFYLLLTTNICLPFLIFGIFSVISKKNKKNQEKGKKPLIILLMLALLTLLMYEFSSIKQPRFLFNLSLPICYFSIFGFNFVIGKIKNKKAMKTVKLVLIVLLLISVISAFVFAEIINSRGFIKEEKIIKQLIGKIDNCTIASDLWVYFDWYGKKASPAPLALNLTKTGKPQIFSMISEGYNIILFKNFEPFAKNKKFIEELESYTIENNDDYIWLRDKSKCKIDEKINNTFIDSLKPFGEFPENFGGCDALMLKLKLRKLCEIFKFL